MAKRSSEAPWFFLLLIVGALVSTISIGPWPMPMPSVSRAPSRPLPAGVKPTPPLVLGEFRPEPDPAAQSTGPLYRGKTGGVGLADGARIQAPPGATGVEAAATIARLRNDPGSLGADGLAGPVYDFRIGDGEQPEKPVEITVPYSGDPERVVLARWTKGGWRPLDSRIDRDAGTVSAYTAHLSPFAAVRSSRYMPGPARVHLGVEGEKVRIPRGVEVDCYLLDSPAVEGWWVNVHEEDLDFVDENGKHVRGRGAVQRVDVEILGPDGAKKKVRAARFAFRVPAQAPLGPRTLVLMGAKDGECDLRGDAFEVCQNPVVIIDIDGLRPDILYPTLGAGSGSALRRLAGASAADGSAGGMSWHGYDNGVGLKESVTVFPTVTYTGQAALFTGTDPGVYKMGGNEWFDRMLAKPYKFGFTGDNLGLLGVGDAHDATVNGSANKRVRDAGISTIYEAAAERHDVKSAVLHNFYFGDGEQAARWYPYRYVLDEVLYVPVRSTWLVDRRVCVKAGEIIREAPADFGILTLYLTGLDHTCHEGPGLVLDKQRKYLDETIDPYLGAYFLSEIPDALYKGTTFIVIADHGLSDMGVRRGQPNAYRHCFKNEVVVVTSAPAPPDSVFADHAFHDLVFRLGYLPQGNYERLDYTVAPLYKVGVGQLQDPAALSAIVGLNAGMAQVYLRRLKSGTVPPPRERTADFDEAKASVSRFAQWSAPPLFSQVLDVAEAFRLFHEGQPVAGDAAPDPLLSRFKGGLDFILVRNAQRGGWNAPYEVYRGPGQPPQEFLAFLKSEKGRQWMTRLEWDASDRTAAFLADRLKRLEGPMAGDLIVIPKYPEYYCEYAPLHGDHGGFPKDDFEIPFLVVRPGAGEKELAHIRKSLEKGIDLRTKDRPSNTDLKQVVLELLEPPAPLTVENPDPAIEPVDAGEDIAWDANIYVLRVTCRKKDWGNRTRVRQFYTVCVVTPSRPIEKIVSEFPEAYREVCYGEDSIKAELAGGPYRTEPRVPTGQSITYEEE